MASTILALYRSILRVHRERLPPPMQAMGNAYLREEFQRHLHGQTTEKQWEQFVNEWLQYKDALLGRSEEDSNQLNEELWDSLSPDQQQRLIMLRERSRNLRDELLGKSKK